MKSKKTGALVARQHDSTLDLETNLVCTRSGWNVVSALVSLGPSYCGVHLLELLPMWKLAMKIRKDRNAESNAKYLIFATSAMARFAESCGDLLRDRQDLCQHMVEMLISPLTLLVSENKRKKNNKSGRGSSKVRGVLMFERGVREIRSFSCFNSFFVTQELPSQEKSRSKINARTHRYWAGFVLS